GCTCDSSASLWVSIGSMRMLCGMRYSVISDATVPHRTRPMRIGARHPSGHAALRRRVGYTRRYRTGGKNPIRSDPMSDDSQTLLQRFSPLLFRISVAVIVVSLLVFLRSLPTGDAAAILRDWIASLGPWGPL